MINIKRKMAVGVNAEAVTRAGELAESGGWLLLAPYGETPYWHEEKPGGGGWKQFRQVFTRTQGERMVAAFNTLAARKGERFRGLPIYAGHPDADPARWPDERRLGGVTGLEARGDGLYVRAAWNDLGEQNRAQGYLVYPSPAWLYDLRTARSSGVIAPDELRSVGLTNTPRLPDVPAWTNSEEAFSGQAGRQSGHGNGAPSLPPEPEPTFPPLSKTNHETQNMNYKLVLLQQLGLPEDAPDEAIQQTHDERLRTLGGVREEATAACAERDQAVADARRFRAAAVNAQLDAAINAGRLSAAEREGFVQRFERDYEEALRGLGERRSALNTQPLGLRPTAPGLDLSTAHGRATAFNARLDALMRPAAAGGRGLRFDAAIAEMRGSAEDAALLQAMNGK